MYLLSSYPFYQVITHTFYKEEQKNKFLQISLIKETKFLLFNLTPPYLNHVST
jgi:hypothetical protein